MHNLLRYKKLASLALLLWLVAGWSGAHEHLCFDGQEPSMSVHMVMTGEHVEHHADEHDVDEQHLDSDVELSKTVLIKLVTIDLPLLLLAVLILLVLHCPKGYFLTDSVQYGRHRTGLRPPLRAPPLSPA